MNGTKKSPVSSQSSHSKPPRAPIYGQTALEWRPPWKWPPEAGERGSASRQVRLHSPVTHFAWLPSYLSRFRIAVSPLLTQCRVVNSCPNSHLHKRPQPCPALLEGQPHPRSLPSREECRNSEEVAQPHKPVTASPTNGHLPPHKVLSLRYTKKGKHQSREARGAQKENLPSSPKRMAPKRDPHPSRSTLIL